MEGKVKAVAKELNNNGIHFETKLQQEEESVTQEIQVKCDDKISEEEKNKICLMRALVEKQDPSSKEVDDFEIRRFLRARDLNVDKASAMLLKCLKWKKSIAPNGFISASEIPNQIAHNKMFMQGVDKQGRPIAVVLGGRHFQNKLGGPDEFKRFVVLALDKLCSRTSPGREKFVVIGDLQGFGYSNSDARAYIGALSILQDCYPERLGKLIVVHVPYLFWTMWKIVYPFIDNKTKKKITFVENKRLMTTLLEDIDESQIPEIYGGKMPLVPIHEA
ncbi:PREDICTED: random slug protein 5-like [Nicotiana attenuata]|uniref:Phosphatidylinositolphosphatidylcholine transfer protein sfh1 n=1 Tax=Nicotiana attenuata TaxID=49451 RepID=A0A1J6JQ03_NICAT|nr:PREDICTED: random slug protein 5-like [Nicotiana attenuata]OIT19326.1 phosphatidylinositolphosphatidylcholine transfer protein sfh1 [Nicotiana attenuata]